MRWMSVARVVNGTLTGEGLLGVWSLGIGGLLLAPVSWLAILFLINQSPEALVATEQAQQATQHSSGPLLSLITSAIVVGVGVVNGALAIPLARSEQRNRELGKHALSILTHIAGYSARIGIGALGLVAPLYLFFDSPIDPLGPPPQAILGGMSIWVPGGLVIGATMGAIELFFFPAGPSRKALRKLRAIVLSRREEYRAAP